MRIRLGLAAVVAALAIAGCGGGNGGGGGSSAKPTRAAFKTGFAQSQREFRQLGLDIVAEIRGAATRSDAALARQFGALATRARQAAGGLTKLKPPAAYQTKLDSLVAGLQAVAGDLQRIATAAAHNNASTAKAASAALLKDAATVKSIDTALSKTLGLSPP